MLSSVVERSSSSELAEEMLFSQEVTLWATGAVQTAEVG